MNDIIIKKRASAKYNGDFIYIESCSGYRLIMGDADVPEYFLESVITDQELGKNLLDALRNSRFLSLEESRVLSLKCEQHHKDWIEKTMARYGYKTKRAMFKKMISCGIEMHEGIITIRPSHHEKLEAWSGGNFTEEDYVKIPVDSSPAEIGAALRLAFSRCTGSGPWDS